MRFDNIWAVGNNANHPLYLTAWMVVQPDRGYIHFIGARTAADDVWAVGAVDDGTVERTLVLHYGA
jgi:hypothetical protein